MAKQGFWPLKTLFIKGETSKMKKIITFFMVLFIMASIPAPFAFANRKTGEKQVSFTLRI